MSKGILYVMTTIVPGLVKIGKTGASQFEHRMYNLEHNGYANVTGLKRKFAIEVEDYDEKEQLLHTIFSKSNVPNTELFALDVSLVIQLLSSFDGTIVYPPKEDKKKAFSDATEDIDRGADEDHKKAKKFRFSMVGLHAGDVLTYISDPDITVTVADDSHVLYEGKTWSMSGLAKHLGGFTHATQGGLWFTYHGKNMIELRKEAEKGKENG